MVAMPFMTQDRIGVHPSNWKLPLHIEGMLGMVDPKIRPIVRVLCAGGFETFESCEGGVGHAYPEATVCFHGNRTEGFRALAWCRTNGIEVGDLRRYWTIEDGEPHGPDWQLTFRLRPWVKGRKQNRRRFPDGGVASHAKRKI